MGKWILLIGASIVAASAAALGWVSSQRTVSEDRTELRKALESKDSQEAASLASAMRSIVVVGHQSGALNGPRKSVADRVEALDDLPLRQSELAQSSLRPYLVASRYAAMFDPDERLSLQDSALTELREDAHAGYRVFRRVVELLPADRYPAERLCVARLERQGANEFEITQGIFEAELARVPEHEQADITEERLQSLSDSHRSLLEGHLLQKSPEAALEQTLAAISVQRDERVRAMLARQMADFFPGATEDLRRELNRMGSRMPSSQ